MSIEYKNVEISQVDLNIEYMIIYIYIYMYLNKIYFW